VADAARATALHERAAALQWPPSIVALGAQLELAGNVADAIKHYERAAALGSADALHELGRCSRFAIGMPKNEFEGKKYCRKALNLGRAECAECIKDKRLSGSIGCTIQ
jgi:TPR repeat protein